MELFSWIEGLSDDAAGLLIGFCAIPAIVLLIVGFSFFRKYRAVNKMPTSRVGSAQSGFVELIGRPEAFEKGRLQSPLTNNPCIWYVYKVERYMRIRKRHDSEAKWQWHTVYYDTSHQYLLLRDHTGFCVIDTDDDPFYRGKIIFVVQAVLEEKFIIPLANVSGLFLVFLVFFVGEPVYRLLMAVSENRRYIADDLPDELGPRFLILFGAFVIGILSMGFMAFGLIVAKTGIEVAMNGGVSTFAEPEYPPTFEEWKVGLTEKDRQRLIKWFPGGMEQAEAYMKKQIERQQRKKQKRQSNTP